MRPLAEELRATAAAQTELGDDYDRAAVHALAERLEAELEARDRGRRTAMLRDVVTVVIALGSIGLGVLVGAAADGLGQGVRYERPEPASTSACAPELHLVSGMADTGRVVDTADRRAAAAQRELVSRLGRAGP